MIDTEEGIYPWQRNKTNRLFVKDEVGRTKHSTFNLPPIDHVYGKAPKKDIENAKQVTMTWIQHKESKDEIPPRDFLTLNRNCVRERYLSAKDIVRYRTAHPEILKKLKKGKSGVEMYLPAYNFSYGIPNKPSTPIKNIVQLQYLQEQEQILKEQYAQIKSEQSKAKKLLVRGNQTTQLRSLSPEKAARKQAEILALSEFKLERFKNIKSKIHTRSVNTYDDGHNHLEEHAKQQEGQVHQGQESI